MGVPDKPPRSLVSGWNRSIVRGVRPNDLAGKAGEVAAELEERLVRGTYRFGEALSIYTLAEQFGASRQPVASAVLYLRSVGYLEIIPQVGCRVVAPTPQEVQDFFVMFSRTEGVIARFAAERHTPDEAAALIEMVEAAFVPLEAPGCEACPPCADATDSWWSCARCRRRRPRVAAFAFAS